MPAIIETIAIGDELLTGKISDTNSTFVADQLFQRGMVLSQQTVVPDQESRMRQSFEEAAKRADVILVFGGLGPTTDDRTVDVVAQLLNCAAIEEPEAYAKMTRLYLERGREVTSTARRQVRYPESAVALSNSVGLAPAFRCSLYGKTFFFLPGVPSEMRAIVQESVLPWIQNHFGEADTVSYVWRCLGIPESVVQEKVASVERGLSSDLWLGFRTRYPENHLTLYGRLRRGKPPEGFEAAKSALKASLEAYVFTEDSRDLEEVVGQRLLEKRKTLSLAESCTGGLVAERLTRVPGISQSLWGSYVVYQVAAKAAMLGVHLQNEAEAVSAKASRLLVEGLQKKSGSDLCAAVTGYLGPGGGSDADPVGTIYLCVGQGSEIFEERMELGARFGRAQLKWGASTYLLDKIRKVLG